MFRFFHTAAVSKTQTSIARELGMRFQDKPINRVRIRPIYNLFLKNSTIKNIKKFIFARNLKGKNKFDISYNQLDSERIALNKVRVSPGLARIPIANQNKLPLG